jgi:hypothetical protein
MRKLSLPKPPKNQVINVTKQVQQQLKKQGKGLKPKPPPHMKGPPSGAGAFPQHPKGPLPAGALPPAPSGLPAPNITYDFFISPHAPQGNNPDTTSTGHLEAEFEMATQHSQLDPNFRWTHRMYVQDSDDVRDNFPAAPANTVYIPANGAANDLTQSTEFLVVFVGVLNRNTPQQYKRVFLKRQAPNWPTDYI